MFLTPRDPNLMASLLRYDYALRTINVILTPFVQIKTLWSAVLTIIKGAPTFNGPFLSLVQNIFISGLRSRHRAIVNECVVAWNQTFAQVESLEYPQELRTILLNLENIIDLELPNLSKSDGDEVSCCFASNLRVCSSSHITGYVLANPFYRLPGQCNGAGPAFK